MQFIYHAEASQTLLTLSGDKFRHIFGSRRAKKQSDFLFCNLQDGYLYHYEVQNIEKKQAQFLLLKKEKKEQLSRCGLHLFWCIIDAKSIYKVLPMLNELGLEKLSFVLCERSQRGEMPDFEKMQRVLIESCEQCGRMDLMQIEKPIDFATLLKKYHDICVVDFGGDTELFADQKRFFVGCEGGFSAQEKELLKQYKKVGFTSHILRSETAAVSIISKAL